MESAAANQVRDAIKQLPVGQRAVAIALKKIFDQIKQLTRKQQQQIDANHLSFISKFKVLQKKASDVVQGKIQLKQQDLDTSSQFFASEQQKQKKDILKQNNKIEHYWFKALSNSQFGPDLSDQQNQMLKAVSDIQTNITTNQIQLIFTVDTNNYISSGVFHRRLVLDNGMPISLEGQQPKWINGEAKDDGAFLWSIFTNIKDGEQLSSIFSLIGSLVNEIIPYSLQYYLGAVERQGQDQQQQEDEEQQDGENQDDQ